MKNLAILMSQATTCCQTGNFMKAERLYRDVLKQDLQNLPALVQLGSVYLAVGKPDQAVGVLERAHKIAPSDAEVLLNLGLACRYMGKRDLAMQYYQNALKINPRDHRLYNNIGGLLEEAGRRAEALPLYIQALQMKPDYAEAHFNLANIFHEQGRVPEAVSLYEQAVREKADFVDAKINLGIALCNLGRHADAEPYFRDVLGAQPQNIRALNNLGNVLRFLGQAKQAIDLFEKAIALRSDYIEAYVNYGTALRDLGQLKEAQQKFEKALRLNPNFVGALISLGTIEQDFGALEKSVPFYEKALAVQPQSVDAAWNMALALLGLGRMEEGWSLYEKGLGHRAFRGLLPYRNKLWQGEDLAGKRLLIWCEQGLGDGLQFVRYAALCKQKGAHVIVRAFAPLASLFRNCPWIDEVVLEANEDSFDYHVSMMSLPHHFGTTLDAVPADVPYLFVDSAARQKWASRIPGDGRLRVGLVWAGNAREDQVNAHLFDKRRSLHLKQLMPLFACDRARFYSLQIGPSSAQIDELDLREKITDYTADIHDFADTAALVENLDLVISVDTSVVHLVGGLGKPVWVLSRFDSCWRWQRNAEHSPWYPTATIFGQSAFGDWEGVVGRVSQALCAFSQASEP